MKSKRLKSVIVLIFFAFMLVLGLFAGQGETSAFADTSKYTDVLTDLKKDSSFNIEDYEIIPNDYSIQVIQIAESESGELFLYTYQPCQKTKKLLATEINMSLSESTDGTKLYSLTHISSKDVFAKYLVEGVTVSSDNVRYYNISSIYRDWIKDIDKEVDSDFVLNAVSFPVGKCYKTITENGVVKYECKEKDIIEILNPYFDFLRYEAGSSFLYNYSCDSHYVAFSTDKDIDKLIEADVSYVTRSCVETRTKHNPFAPDYKIEYGDPQPPVVMTISDKDKGHSDFHNFWFIEGEDKEFYRIQSVDEFLNTEVVNDETKTKLNDRQWVLRFLETEYKTDWQAVQRTYSTNVSEVIILRLKFETDGKVYNLGAVSDKGTADNKPGNEMPPVGFWRYIWNCIVKLFKGTASLTEQIVAVVALFLVLLALPILLTVLSLCIPSFGAVMKTILKALWTGIKYLFIGLWYVITSPVRLIVWIVKKTKGE